MSLGVSCLFQNTEAVKLLDNSIKLLVGERLANNQSANFPEIYAEIRKEGIEVDAQTLGTIYSNIYGAYTSSEFSTIDEVDAFAGRDYENQLKSLTENILGETDAPKEETIGNLNPENQIVTSISKLFQAANFPSSEKLQSVMKSMETLVTQAAKNLLPKNEQGNTKTLNDALTKFFKIDGAGFLRADGTLNTLKTLTDKVKSEVSNYVEQIAANLDDAEADLLRQQWDAYTNAFVNSVYDITLTKSNQNKLIQQSLKQVKIDGVNILDFNGNVKWSALIEFGNPDTIADKVAEIFRNGFKDENGNTVKYTREQSDRIGEYFLREYKVRLANATQRTISNNRQNNKSPKNIISDFIKAEGFFDLVKDKDGKLLLSKVDWSTLLKRIKEQVGSRATSKDIGGLDLIKVELQKYLNTKPFNDQQKKIITDEFINTILAKLEPSTSDATDIDRLIALNQLNNGVAFNASTQSAINKLVGVNNIQQATLNKIKALASAAQSIMQGNNVPNNTASTNPLINRGAYAFQALSEIDRKIKEILRDSKIDSSQTQTVVKYMADLMGGATTTLLLNPNNAIENVTTGLFTNLAESLNLLFKNPRLFSKIIGSSQKDFWVTWANYALGGSYSEITSEADLNNDIQSSERLRVRAAIEQVKGKGVKELIGVMLQSPQFTISTFSRVFMNSFDAAFNSAILRKRMIFGAYDAIKNQGLLSNGKNAFQALDKALNIDIATLAELDLEANRIFSIMNRAGFPVTAAFKAQTKRDLRMSLYEDVMQDVGADKGATFRKATEATKLLIESAQSQSKMLTGKKQLRSTDVLTQLVYGSANAVLAPQKILFKKSKDAEEKGSLKKAAKLQAAATLMQNTYGKFLGGAANFLSLGLSSTPYGFVMANNLRRQGRDLGDVGAADVFESNPEDARRYAEFQGMARSIAIRAMLGTSALVAFLIKNLGIDDDDENEEDGLSNLIQTKTGRRLVQKHYPIMIALAAGFIYKTKDKKKKGLDMIFEMGGSYIGKDYDAYNNLVTGFKYAKTEDDYKEVWAKFAGGYIPSFNINQAEQFYKFNDAVESFFDKKEIKDVERNEAISKNMYKSIEGVMDALLINGAIESTGRLFSDKPFNRYQKK